ncbi:MAG: flagellar export protein FliJ [Caldimonas sp.]
MTDVQPLIALLARHERERDLALADQSRAKSRDDAAQAQVEQLLAYRRQYEERWRTQFAQSGQIEVVRCYQGFVERLTQAVEAQQRTAAQARAQLGRAETVSREHEMKVAAVKQLIARRYAEARLEANRRDQKQDDELAARMAWSRRAATGGPRVA